MEINILKALFQLAKDILENPIGSADVQLNENLFSHYDVNQISLTLKNYDRPNGVATQIFQVDLSGYIQDNSVIIEDTEENLIPSESADLL